MGDKKKTDTIKENHIGAERIIAKMLGLGTQIFVKRLMLIMLLSVNIIQKTVIVLTQKLEKGLILIIQKTVIVLTQKLEKGLILIMLLKVKIIIIVFVEKIRQID